jgi:hypothetical protein
MAQINGTSLTGCQHENCQATVEVVRLTAVEGGPVTSFTAQVRIWCADCDEPFQWVGMPIGLSPLIPMVSVDGRELRAPLRPASAPPGFGQSGPAFHVRIRE